MAKNPKYPESKLTDEDKKQLVGMAFTCKDCGQKFLSSSEYKRHIYKLASINGVVIVKQKR